MPVVNLSISAGGNPLGGGEQHDRQRQGAGGDADGLARFHDLPIVRAPAVGEVVGVDLRHRLGDEVDRGVPGPRDPAGGIEEADRDRARGARVAEGALQKAHMEQLDAALAHGVALGPGGGREKRRRWQARGLGRRQDIGVFVAALVDRVADRLAVEALLRRAGHRHEAVLRQRHLGDPLETGHQLDLDPAARCHAMADHVRVHELDAASRRRLQQDADPDRRPPDQTRRRHRRVHDVGDDALGGGGNGERDGDDNGYDAKHVFDFPYPMTSPIIGAITTVRKIPVALARRSRPRPPPGAGVIQSHQRQPRDETPERRADAEGRDSGGGNGEGGAGREAVAFAC